MDSFIVLVNFSSSKIFTTNSSKSIFKYGHVLFKHDFKSILVQTNKINQKTDLYAVAKIKEVKDNIAYCIVSKYFDEDIYLINKHILQYGGCVNWSFSKSIVKDFNSDTDLTPQRKFINETIYTIDPKGCIDMDDALHYKKLDNGYEIGIHIADPSSYFSENSSLDNELKKRCETIYDIHDQNMHMFPDYIVQLFSLFSNEEKRAFSIIINFDNDSKIIDYRFTKSLINVSKNLSYEDAEKLLSTDISIKGLFDIAKHHKYLLNSDSLSFDMHDVVAVYMIMINKFAAETIVNHNPNNVILKSNPISDRNPNKSLSKHPLYKYYLMNYCESAIYQIGINNSHHHGLNLDYYTHFSSPIRRYVDIIIHRQLWNIINNIDIKLPDQNLIDSINYSRKYIKTLTRYSFINNLNLEKLKFDGNIVFFDKDNLNYIKVYIKEFNMTFGINIVPNDLLHLYNFDLDENNNIVMTNLNTNDIIRYCLFDNIDINVSHSNSTLYKLVFSISH